MKGTSDTDLVAVFNDFHKGFAAALIEQSLPWLPQLHRQWPEERIFASWFSLSLDRALFLQEADTDGNFDICNFFGDYGPNDTYRVLTIMARDVRKHLEAILDAYRRWLVDGSPEENVSEVLSSVWGSIQ